MYPGLALGHEDTGLAGLGCFDHAFLSPGLVVPMHEHREDEIVSYLRHGRMIHRDSSGVMEEIGPQRLMVMNSGRGFSHEEEVPSQAVEMLQIFVRPHTERLDPQVEFAAPPEGVSRGQWRPIFIPEHGDGPVRVRQQAWGYDAQIREGQTLDVTIPDERAAGFLYVMEGSIGHGGESLGPGDGLVLPGGGREAVPASHGPASVFLFVLRTDAVYSRSGTLSR